MATYYKKEGGQFHFHDDLIKHDGDKPMIDEKGEYVREEKLVHSSEKIAFAYCRLHDRVHMFTHGTLESMQKWVESHNAHSPHKAELKIFDQSTPADVVTRAIVDHAFFSTLL